MYEGCVRCARSFIDRNLGDMYCADFSVATTVKVTIYPVHIRMLEGDSLAMGSSPAERVHCPSRNWHCVVVMVSAAAAPTRVMSANRNRWWGSMHASCSLQWR